MMKVPHGPRVWRKSSRSAQQTDCVELAWDGAVRDSKNPDAILTVELGGLMAAVKTDQISH